MAAARRTFRLRGAELSGLGRAGDLGATAHYDDVAYYDKTYRKRRADIDFYVRLARLSGGPVLEYGVGNGRVALAIARAGVEVVGMDLSRNMLRSLRAQLEREPPQVAERVTALRGDMRKKCIDARFPLVIAPFNVFLHLYDREDVEQFLARVREHLLPRGRLVFDFSVPVPGDLDRDPEERFGTPRFKHPETGQLCRYWEQFEYDPLRQVLLVWLNFEPVDGSEPWSVPLTHRQYFPREVEALLHYNGFDDLEWSADFTDAEPHDKADSLVVSARARAPRRKK